MTGGMVGPRDAVSTGSRDEPTRRPRGYTTVGHAGNERSSRVSNGNVRKALGGLAVAVLVSAGCVPASRLNADCTWTRHQNGSLDLSGAADRRHLAQDLIVAEELAVRYADARVPPPRGPTRDTCLAQLTATIARDHALTAAEVEAYRGRRDGWWDAALFVVLGLAFSVMVRTLVGVIRERFDSPHASAVVLVCAALPVALVGVAAGEWISLVAEGVRVSNLSHLSGFRGERIPWRHHRLEIAAASVALFTVVAVASVWWTRPRARVRL